MDAEIISTLTAALLVTGSCGSRRARREQNGRCFLASPGNAFDSFYTKEEGKNYDKNGGVDRAKKRRPGIGALRPWKVNGWTCRDSSRRGIL